MSTLEFLVGKICFEANIIGLPICVYILFEIDLVLYLGILAFPFHKNALYRVLIFLAQWLKKSKKEVKC